MKAPILLSFPTHDMQLYPWVLLFLLFAKAIAFAWVPFGHCRRLQCRRLLNVEMIIDGMEVPGPIRPLGNNILVKLKDTLTATSGGILLPDQSKERPTEGVVVAAGPGKLHPYTGVRIVNPIREGVSVLYGKFDGRPMEYNGEECQMIRDDDVLLYYSGVTIKLDAVIPVRDYVLIECDEEKGDKSLQTSSGVMIAQQVMKGNNPCEGVVAKVGEGRMASKGNLTPSPVEVGDRVKFKDYAGNEVMIEGKLYTVVKMVNILSTMKSAELSTEQS